MKRSHDHESIIAAVDKFQRFFTDLKEMFNKTYGIDQRKKPKNIHEAIERKKNNQPFYKSSNKKPWE